MNSRTNTALSSSGFNSHRTGVLARAAVAIVAGAGASAAIAQPLTQTVQYNVQHTFQFGPGVPGILPVVNFFSFAHSWLKETTWQDADYWDPFQDPDFDEYGTDWLGGGGHAFNTGLFGIPVPCRYTNTTVGPGGLTNTWCTQTLSPVSGSVAHACVDANILPYGPGSLVTGSFGSQGDVRASIGGGTSYVKGYAFSTAAMSVRIPTVNGRGQIVWTTHIDAVGGDAAAKATRRDPLVLEATDLSGVSSSGVMFDVELSSTGGRVLNWSNGVLTVDADDAQFQVVIPPGAAMNPGAVRIDVQGGVVVDATANGRYLTVVLPPIGTVVPFSVAIPTDTIIDFDAHALVPVPIDMTLTMDGAGDAPVSIGSTCKPDLTHSALPGTPGYGEPDGELTNDDFFYFLSQFAEGNVGVCDLTASAVPGSPGYGVPNGVITNDDFFYYLTIFAAGC